METFIMVLLVAGTALALATHYKRLSDSVKKRWLEWRKKPEAKNLAPDPHAKTHEGATTEKPADKAHPPAAPTHENHHDPKPVSVWEKAWARAFSLFLSLVLVAVFAVFFYPAIKHKLGWNGDSNPAPAAYSNRGAQIQAQSVKVIQVEPVRTDTTIDLEALGQPFILVLDNHDHDFFFEIDSRDSVRIDDTWYCGMNIKFKIEGPHVLEFRLCNGASPTLYYRKKRF